MQNDSLLPLMGEMFIAGFNLAVALLENNMPVIEAPKVREDFVNKLKQTFKGPSIVIDTDKFCNMLYDSYIEGNKTSISVLKDLKIHENITIPQNIKEQLKKFENKTVH